MTTPAGPERERRGLSVNDFRSFARRQARVLGEPQVLIPAIAEFTTEALLVDQRIGPPEFHHQRVMRVVSRQGLSPEQTARASIIGTAAYSAFKALRQAVTSDEIEALTPEATRMYREAMDQRRKTPKNKRQLRTIDSSSPPDSGSTNVNASPRDQLAQAKEIRLAVRGGIDKEALVDAASGALKRNVVLRLELGDERFDHFYDFVLRLIRGVSITAEEITAAGLDPNEVLKNARNKHNDFLISSSQAKHSKRLEVRRKLYWETRI